MLRPVLIEEACGLQASDDSLFFAYRNANNESSEAFDIIKPGRRVKIKGYRQ